MGTTSYVLFGNKAVVTDVENLPGKSKKNIRIHVDHMNGRSHDKYKRFCVWMTPKLIQTKSKIKIMMNHII